MNCLSLAYAMLSPTGSPQYPSYFPETAIVHLRGQVANVYRRQLGPSFPIYIDQISMESAKCSLSGTYEISDDYLVLRWKELNKEKSEKIPLDIVMSGGANLTSSSDLMAEINFDQKANGPNLENYRLSPFQPNYNTAFWVGLGGAVVLGSIYLLSKEEKKEVSPSKKGKIQRKKVSLGITF